MLLTREEITGKYRDQLNRLVKQGSDDSFSILPQHKVFVKFSDTRRMLLDPDQKEIEGFAVLGKRGKYWYFRNCVVKKEYRGRGIQRQLIQERLDYARNNGGGSVSVGIDPRNTKSLNNILSFGFKFKAGGMKHNDHWYQKLKVTV